MLQKLLGKQENHDDIIMIAKARRSIMEDIYSLLEQMNKQEVELPLCSVVVKHHYDGQNDIYIVEKFSDRTVNLNYESFGYQVEYHGNSYIPGLLDVMIKAIEFDKEEVLTVKGSGLVRYADTERKRDHITKDDINRYDILLLYARKTLKELKGKP